MRVQQLMTRAVWTCSPADSLDKAARRMRDHGCGCVVVVDEKDRVCAVVTDRDICLCALRTLRPLQMLRVSDAMSSEIFTCGPEASVAEAEELMAQRRVRRLPVVDARGALVGVVSLDDMAREAGRVKDLPSKPVTAAEVGLTLATVARPRIVPES
jgi:CBS domain-containing protein